VETLVNWVEILAALTVAAIFLPALTSRAEQKAPPRQYVNYADDPVVQEKLEAIKAEGPYRDYSNLVVNPATGRIFGGL
jgi:hypothetical protein